MEPRSATPRGASDYVSPSHLTDVRECRAKDHHNLSYNGRQDRGLVGTSLQGPPPHTEKLVYVRIPPRGVGRTHTPPRRVVGVTRTSVPALHHCPTSESTPVSHWFRRLSQVKQESTRALTGWDYSMTG